MMIKDLDRPMFRLTPTLISLRAALLCAAALPLLLCIGGGPALAAAPREAALAALRAAASDDVELERVATRLGPAHLLRIAATQAQRQQALTALRGLGLSGALHPEVAQQALLPLCDLLSRSTDPRVLEAGAEAAERLARSVTNPRVLDEGDFAQGDELPRAAALLLRLSADGALNPLTRADLLRAAISLSPAPLRDPQALAALARGDEGPGAGPVREVALQALAAREGAGDALHALCRAEDAELSAAALGAACDMGNGQALPADLAARVRTLAGPRGGVSPQGRRGLAGCLRRLNTAQDRALLGGLSERRGKERR
jgi:hypothetical protein